MPDYHSFMMRHGEFGVQALIEQLERVGGMTPDLLVPLEQRWANVMGRPGGEDRSFVLAAV